MAKLTSWREPGIQKNLLPKGATAPERPNRRFKQPKTSMPGVPGKVPAKAPAFQRANFSNPYAKPTRVTPTLQGVRRQRVVK